jgi:hypothetical protein
MRVEWIGKPATYGELAGLPSGDSAEALVRGEPGALPKVVGHTLLRAGLIGGALSVAGMTWKTGLARYSLAGALGIETFVLVWAWLKQERK